MTSRIASVVGWIDTLSNLRRSPPFGRHRSEDHNRQISSSLPAMTFRVSSYAAVFGGRPFLPAPAIPRV